MILLRYNGNKDVNFSAYRNLLEVGSLVVCLEVYSYRPPTPATVHIIIASFPNILSANINCFDYVPKTDPAYARLEAKIKS